MIISAQIIGGLILLLLGGDVLVKGALRVAKKLGVSNIVIGITVVAMGTSAPELLVSIQAAYSQHADIAIGNIIGSNISNILLVLGVTTLIFPIKVEKRLAEYDNYVMALATLLLVIFLFTGMLVFWQGIILLILFSAYTYREIHSHKNNSQKDIEIEESEEIEAHTAKNKNIWIGVGLTIVGIILLILGANLLVEGAVAVARSFGLSEAVIGVTLVAIGSSAPELATSVMAAFRKHSSIALANVVGSNILNIVLGMGAAALVADMPVNKSFLEFDIWVLLIATLGLIIWVKTHSIIPRFIGGLFFLGYVGYIFSLFLMNNTG